MLPPTSSKRAVEPKIPEKQADIGLESKAILPDDIILPDKKDVTAHNKDIKPLEEPIVKKDLGGRPLLYKSAKKLKEDIEGYFKSCFGPLTDKDNHMVKMPQSDEYYVEQIKPFTVGGLAVYLETSRRTLLNYERREKYFHIIRRAKDICEAYSEERLFFKESCNGAKFSLINGFGGWAADKTETPGDQYIFQQINVNNSGVNDLVREIGSRLSERP